MRWARSSTPWWRRIRPTGWPNSRARIRDTAPMTPDGAIATASVRLAAAGIERPRAEARRLWEAADREAARFESLLRRREAHEPFAYITGQKEFWSLDFKVGPGV